MLVRRPGAGLRPTRPGRAVVLGIVGGFLAMSCATGTEKLVRRAVPAGIDETLEAFEDPENQKRIKKLLGLPEVKEAARELGEGLTSGALDGLTDEQKITKAKQLSEDYVAALTRAVGKGLHEDVSPAVAEATEKAVERAVRAALAPETRRDATALVDALTRRTVTSLSESLRDDLGPAMQTVLEHNLGPAMQKVIEDNLGPAMQKVIEKDLAPAMRSAASDLAPAAGVVSREVSREMVLGVVDAFAVLDKDASLSGATDGFWGRLNATLNQGIRASEILAWILALIVLILGLVLIRSIFVRRSLEAERERSERMLIGILQELQRGGEVRVDHVIDKVRQRDPDLARSPTMTEMIRRAMATARDLFDGRPDLDGKSDKPKT